MTGEVNIEAVVGLAHVGLDGFGALEERRAPLIGVAADLTQPGPGPPGESSAPFLTGWRGYFGFCETPSVLRKLDAWIRRHLRMMLWRQWKRGRTGFAELRQLWVGRDLAAQPSSGPQLCLTQSLCYLAWPAIVSAWVIAQPAKLAGYGPVRPVVRQGKPVRAYLCRLPMVPKRGFA